MIEQKYTEVFEFIKSNLVPKNQFDESQKEIFRLKSALENATEKLNEMQLECEDQKDTIDIIQAEKDSLQAEKENLEATKKTFEVKFNEVSLKLKQKTKQYDFLLKSQTKNQKDAESITVDIQKIKEEPNEIRIVNVPSSTPARQNGSTTKTGTKRVHSSKDEVQRTKAKRKKSMLPKADNLSSSRTTTKPTHKFSCESCLDNWGLEIKYHYLGNPEKRDAPDPKQNIQTFSSFEDYKNHHIVAHSLSLEYVCKEESCHLYSDHNDQGLWPHGDINCEICNLSFKLQKHHDEHMKFEHADINMLSNKETYDLFLKYQGVSDQ